MIDKASRNRNFSDSSVGSSQLESNCAHSERCTIAERELRSSASTIDVRTKFGILFTSPPPFNIPHPTTRNGLNRFSENLSLSKPYNQSAMFALQTFRASLPRRCIAATSVRTYASQTPGNPMLEVFNRKTKHLQKDRAARNVEESRKVDYLKDEVAMRLCERLLVRSSTKRGTRVHESKELCADCISF